MQVSNAERHGIHAITAIAGRCARRWQRQAAGVSYWTVSLACGSGRLQTWWMG
jgi:hypothetical protein